MPWILKDNMLIREVQSNIKPSVFFTNSEGIPASVKISKVIFHDPATVIMWTDGTKTVVKANNEPFDKEKGLAMAICKKVCGNKGNFNEIFKKYCHDED